MQWLGTWDNIPGCLKTPGYCSALCLLSVFYPLLKLSKFGAGQAYCVCICELQSETETHPSSSVLVQKKQKKQKY